MESYSKPSIFELASQDQLRDFLQPVSKYILSVFAQRHPRYLLRIYNKHDEFFALTMLLVEHHYLTTWNASFSESFYSLKRRRISGFTSEQATAAVEALTGSAKLTKRDVYGSLVFLVGIPYVRTKLQDYYERLGGGIDQDLFADEQTTVDDSQIPWRERTQTRLKNLYVKIYPYLNTSYELWLLFQTARYLFNQTPYYRPWLAFLRLTLRRLSLSELQSVPPPPRGLQRKLLHYALESVRYALPLALFAFKFLEWWHSSPVRTSSRSFYSKDVLPPLKPPTRLPAQKGTVAPKRGECPICQKQMVNATALTTSGWVGCYRCVHEYVGKEKKCPVTGVATSTADLRKIIG